jgi:hypothetical protein
MLSTYLTTAITVLQIFASRTATRLDDTVLALLIALRDSPKMLEAIENNFDALVDWLDKQDDAAIPDGALAVQAMPAGFETAFNDSQPLLDWVGKRRANLPPGSQPLNVPALLELIKYLPVILEILKAFRNQKSQ